MKSTLMAVSAVALTATAASAGGFERSTLPLGFMFEKGNYAELSFGSVSPSVSGNYIPSPSPTTGDVAQSYSTIGLAFKTDLNEKLSLGLTLDPTFGADIAYPTGTFYPIAGLTAKLRGDTIAMIARYKISEKVSVHGGLRSVGVGGNVSLFKTGTNFYNATFAQKRDLGYLVGVAFEKPEIALRVALTYASETQHDLDVSGVYAFDALGDPLIGGPAAFTGTTIVKLPQALTLDFQSGIAKDTLVFGSIRWMDWTKTVLVAPNAGSANPIASYASDTITYNIGVGRKFSDAISGAISVAYEEHKGVVVGDVGPTDGLLSLQVGGTYTHDNMKISAGVRYVDIGNATALRGAGSFSGNSAVAVGMKVGFSF